MKKILCVMLSVLMIFSVCFVANGSVIAVAEDETGVNVDVTADDTNEEDDTPEEPETPEEPAEDGKWIGAWGSGMTHFSMEDYINFSIPLNGFVFRTILTPTASGSKVRIRISNIYGKKDLVVSYASIALQGEEGSLTDFDVNDNLIGEYLPDSIKQTIQSYQKNLSGAASAQQMLKVLMGLFSSTNDYSTNLASMRTLTYKGSSDIVVPAGEEIYTDYVDFDVKAQQKLAVTMFFKENTEISTVGLYGGDTYVALNQEMPDVIKTIAMDEFDDYLLLSSDNQFIKITGILDKMPDIHIVPFLSGVDVYNTEDDPYSVLIIGDSTVTNEIPNIVAKNILAENVTSVGVVGKGIIGNSLLVDGQGTSGKLYGSSILNRMDVDVIAQSGVRYVLLKVGANDIMHPVSESIRTEYGGYYEQPSAQDIIKGYTEFANRCHDYGIKVIGCTITQWKNTTRNYFGKNDTDEYKFDPDDWAIAAEVNQWMTKTDVLDGCIDMTTPSASSSDPYVLNSNWTKDYIHPNAQGQQAWAKLIDLSILGIKTVPTSISLNKSSATLGAGSKLQLKAIIKPDTAALTDVTWTSSKPSVATVTQDGMVYAQSDGSAKITATTVNGKEATCSVIVATKVKGVSISANEVTLYPTQTKSLTATITPETAANKTVSWVSSNTQVATVSTSGKITAVSAGICDITCITNDGSYKAVCKVTVEKGVSVTGLTLNKENLTMYKDNTFTLEAVIAPVNATNKNLTWTSSDESVATIKKGANGAAVITALKKGSTTITVKTQDGGYTKICKVTVQTAVSSVSLSKNTLGLYTGKGEYLVETVSPAGATNKAVKWSSSDPTVATVDSEGYVEGVSEGTAVITCTSKQNPSLYATCEVTVKRSIQIESVALNYSSNTLKEGTTCQLEVLFTPENATNKKVTWTSSNTSVAKVSTKGLVTAVAKGTATITVRTADGDNVATCKITVTGVSVTGITLDAKTLTLNAGASKTLKATIKPANASNKTLTWTSSNKKVATVSSKGKITAVGAGTCTITCKASDGSGKKATCKVTVKNVAVTGVSLSSSVVTVNVGKTKTLTASVKPSTASNKNVTWSTSNKNVATVADGKITGVKAGTCTVTVKTKDGGYKANCKVTVKKATSSAVIEDLNAGGNKVTGITLSATTVSMKAGATKTLTATVKPSNATNKNVSWTSSNTSVVKVSSAGKITAVAKGTATITCKAKDGSGKKATCKVTVTSGSSSGTTNPTTPTNPGTPSTGKAVTVVNSSYGRVVLGQNESRITLRKGQTYQLHATVYTPTTASVKWESKDPNIATVSGGKITAKSAGTVYIYCTNTVNNDRCTCTVVVTG